VSRLTAFKAASRSAWSSSWVAALI
jgi:hypothetical protein